MGSAGFFSSRLAMFPQRQHSKKYLNILKYENSNFKANIYLVNHTLLTQQIFEINKIVFNNVEIYSNKQNKLKTLFLRTGNPIDKRKQKL